MDVQRFQREAVYMSLASNVVSAAEAAAQRSLAMVQRQRELGVASQLESIIAQQTYQEAAMILVQAQASRHTNTVALFQALSGGWWHSGSETDAAPTASD